MCNELITLSINGGPDAVPAALIQAAVLLQLNSVVQIGRFDLAVEVFLQRWVHPDAVPADCR